MNITRVTRHNIDQVRRHMAELRYRVPVGMRESSPETCPEYDEFARLAALVEQYVEQRDRHKYAPDDMPIIEPIDDAAAATRLRLSNIARRKAERLRNQA